MSANTKKLIRLMMSTYRNSPLHNAFVGAILAKVLALFTIFRKKQITVDIEGVIFNLDLREVIDSSLYYSGTFEPKIENIIESVLKPGMNVIDIGANIGYHTFRMAKLVQPNGRVLAVEPTSYAYTKLQHNAALNSQFNNITYAKVGLAKEDLGEQTIAFQSSYRLTGYHEIQIEQVRLMKLDTLVQEQKLERVDFIKLDVDGFEGQVLLGAVETFQKFTPGLVIEITPSEMIKNGDDPVKSIEFLKTLNYAFFDEDYQKIHDIEQKISQLPAGFSMMVFALPATDSKKRQVIPS